METTSVGKVGHSSVQAAPERSFSCTIAYRSVAERPAVWRASVTSNSAATGLALWDITDDAPASLSWIAATSLCANKATSAPNFPSDPEVPPGEYRR